MKLAVIRNRNRGRPERPRQPLPQRHRRPEPATMNAVLDEIAEKANGDGDTLTIREMLDSVGRRSYGPLLLVIGLFAISPATIVPGMTWFAAALTLIVAGQMALGMRRVWLPDAALRARISRQAVHDGVERSRGAARVIDRLLKPRLKFLSGPPFVNLIALFCIGAALATFPLGLIPFAPLIPGFAVVFFGLGMTARDGLWLLAGSGAFAAAFWLAVRMVF